MPDDRRPLMPRRNPEDIDLGAIKADLEFLMRVARKIETIREDLGKVGPVIAQQVEEAMLGRRMTLNTAQAEKDAEPVRRMLKFERDLAKHIKALMEQYRETQKERRLSPDNIEKVVKVALDLAGQPPLLPANEEETTNNTNKTNKEEKKSPKWFIRQVA